MGGAARSEVDAVMSLITQGGLVVVLVGIWRELGVIRGVLCARLGADPGPGAVPPDPRA